MVGLVEERRHVTYTMWTATHGRSFPRVSEWLCTYCRFCESKQTAQQREMMRNGRQSLLFSHHWSLVSQRQDHRTGWTSIEKAEKNEPNECEWRHWSWRSSRISMLGLDPWLHRTACIVELFWLILNPDRDKWKERIHWILAWIRSRAAERTVGNDYKGTEYAIYLVGSSMGTRNREDGQCRIR